MNMKKLLLTLSLLALAIAVQAEMRVVVRSGDVDGFLKAIEQANQTNKEPTADRFYILLSDGTYDLGKRVLTTITGHNVSIVGQSMEGTVIVNAPDIKDEGISKTATLRNFATGLHLQDLTLKNALKYYESGFAGRAVCLQDKGTRTICNRVRMLSYQDTYYSDNDEGQYYFNESEIHGTVDFICGAGDIVFDRCTLVTERRSADGKGRCVIAAPRTSKTRWGYVFDHCVIRNIVSPFHFARAWRDTPHCIWLYTTLENPDKIEKTRFEPKGMGTCKADFAEYMTMDRQGTNLTPPTHVMTFTLKEERHTQETVLSKKQARQYTIKKIFPDWRPEKILKKLERQSARQWRLSP